MFFPIPNKKSLLALFSSIAGGSIFFVTNKGDSSFTEATLQEIQISPEDVNYFLKVGSTDKQLKDLVKDYLKTVSGAKTLAKKLSSGLIVNFIDSWTDSETSSTKDKLKNEFSFAKRSSSVDQIASAGKDEALKLFGGDTDKYQYHHTLKKARKVFEDSLLEVLNSTSLSTSTSNLKNENTSDLLLKQFSKFWDFVLEDYITHERPIPVKKLMWKYDSAKKTKEIRNLFDSNEITADMDIPEYASYFFPFVSSTTEEKFKKFMEKHKSTSGSTISDSDLKTYSDDEQIDFMIPVTSISDPSFTSQFAISLLELYYYYYYLSEIGKNGGLSAESKNSLYGNATGSSNDVCDTNDAIKEVVAGDQSTVQEVFCIKKEQNPFKTKKPAADFFFLKHSGSSTDSQSNKNNWIVYKDSNGIHALTIDPEFIDKHAKLWKEKSDRLKGYLINHSKEVDSNKYKFSIKEALAKHLNKHFERLFLGYWENFTVKEQSSSSSSSNPDSKYKDVAKYLSKLLAVDSYGNNIQDLRRNVLKDYVRHAEIEFIKSGGKIKPNPKLGFAGKFPYKYGSSSRSYSSDPRFSRTRFNTDPLTPFLEVPYLAKLSVNPTINEVPALFKGAKDDFKTYSDKIDSLFTSSSSITSETKKEGSESLYLFKKASSSDESTESGKVKEIPIEDVLNDVWISMLSDRDAVDFLVQDSLKSKLKFLTLNDNEWTYNSTSVIDSSNNNLFKDSSQDSSQDLTKTILKNLLLHHHLRDLTSSAPRIWGKFDLSQISSSTDKIKEFLEKMEKNKKMYFSSEGVDILHPSNKKLFYELVAIKWLSDNKFENFREYLRQKLPRNGFSAFTFVRKFDKDGVCLPSDSLESGKNGLENTSLKFEESGIWTLKSKYLDSNTSSSDTSDSKDLSKCASLEESLNYALVPKSTGSETVPIVGYKGLVTKDWHKLLPQEMSDLLVKNYWKDNESLIKGIELIKSEEELDALIEELKQQHKNIDWSVVEAKERILSSNFNFNWSSAAQTPLVLEKQHFSLEERKTILKNYLKSNESKSFSKNASAQYISNFQRDLLSSTSSNGSNNLLNNDAFSSFTNLLTDKHGRKIIEDAQGNKYLVYLFQIKYSDVENTANWTNFMKTISMDLFTKELVKAAQDPENQKKAIFSRFSDSSGDTKLDTFSTGDSRLKRLIDFSMSGKSSGGGQQ